MSNFKKLTKVCGSCKIRKSISEFSKDKSTKDGFRCYCKKCSHRKARKKYDIWTAAQKEKNNRASEKWLKKHPDKHLNSQLKFYYGITLENYNLLFQQQNGRCFICERHQSELNKRLVVDHNHITKKVRGLICQRCNALLGMARVDVQKEFLLQAAIKYIEEKDE